MREPDARSRYRELCKSEPTIPLFSRDWWLDAVCDTSTWDVVLVERDSCVIAALPYCMRKRLGYRIIDQPQLTQTMGPWLGDLAGTYTRGLSAEKGVMEELICKLPHFDHFAQSWHHSRTNWLPFHWHGFKQTTAYTYILHDLADRDRLWKGLQGNIRTEIKKASGRYALRVRDDLDLDDFLVLNRMTFARQGLAVPYPESIVRRLDAACAARDCRQILIAEDADGRRHAGVYVVWDGSSAYYLMGAGDPDLRSSGATSLCLWEAIGHVATVTASFDFEGSMIRPIERFFRAFGALQTPYFHVTKTPSRLLRLRQASALIRNKGARN